MEELEGRLIFQCDGGSREEEEESSEDDTSETSVDSSEESEEDMSGEEEVEDGGKRRATRSSGPSTTTPAGVGRGVGRPPGTAGRVTRQKIKDETPTKRLLRSRKKSPVAGSGSKQQPQVFPCPNCKKEFGSKASVNRHVRWCKPKNKSPKKKAAACEDGNHNSNAQKGVKVPQQEPIVGTPTPEIKPRGRGRPKKNLIPPPPNTPTTPVVVSGSPKRQQLRVNMTEDDFLRQRSPDSSPGLQDTSSESDYEQREFAANAHLTQRSNSVSIDVINPDDPSTEHHLFFSNDSSSSQIVDDGPVQCSQCKMTYRTAQGFQNHLPSCVADDSSSFSEEDDEDEEVDVQGMDSESGWQPQQQTLPLPVTVEQTNGETVLAQRTLPVAVNNNCSVIPEENGRVSEPKEESCEESESSSDESFRRSSVETESESFPEVEGRFPQPAQAVETSLNRLPTEIINCDSKREPGQAASQYIANVSVAVKDDKSEVVMLEINDPAYKAVQQASSAEMVNAAAMTIHKLEVPQQQHQLMPASEELEQKAVLVENGVAFQQIEKKPLQPESLIHSSPIPSVPLPPPPQQLQLPQQPQIVPHAHVPHNYHHHPPLPSYASQPPTQGQIHSFNNHVFPTHPPPPSTVSNNASSSAPPPNQLLPHSLQNAPTYTQAQIMPGTAVNSVMQNMQQMSTSTYHPMSSQSSAAQVLQSSRFPVAAVYSSSSPTTAIRVQQNSVQNISSSPLPPQHLNQPQQQPSNIFVSNSTQQQHLQQLHQQAINNQRIQLQQQQIQSSQQPHQFAQFPPQNLTSSQPGLPTQFQGPAGQAGPIPTSQQFPYLAPSSSASYGLNSMPQPQMNSSQPPHYQIGLPLQSNMSSHHILSQEATQSPSHQQYRPVLMPSQNGPCGEQQNNLMIQQPPPQLQQNVGVPSLQQPPLQTMNPAQLYQFQSQLQKLSDYQQATMLNSQNASSGTNSTNTILPMPYQLGQQQQPGSAPQVPQNFAFQQTPGQTASPVVISNNNINQNQNFGQNLPFQFQNGSQQGISEQQQQLQHQFFPQANGLLPIQQQQGVQFQAQQQQEPHRALQNNNVASIINQQSWQPKTEPQGQVTIHQAQQLLAQRQSQQSTSTSVGDSPQQQQYAANQQTPPQQPVTQYIQQIAQLPDGSTVILLAAAPQNSNTLTASQNGLVHGQATNTNATNQYQTAAGVLSLIPGLQSLPCKQEQQPQQQGPASPQIVQCSLIASPNAANGLVPGAHATPGVSPGAGRSAPCPCTTCKEKQSTASAMEKFKKVLPYPSSDQTKQKAIISRPALIRPALGKQQRTMRVPKGAVIIQNSNNGQLLQQQQQIGQATATPLRMISLAMKPAQQPVVAGVLLETSTSNNSTATTTTSIRTPITSSNVAVVRPMENPLQKLSDQISQIESTFAMSPQQQPMLVPAQNLPVATSTSPQGPHLTLVTASPPPATPVVIVSSPSQITLGVVPSAVQQQHLVNPSSPITTAALSNSPLSSPSKAGVRTMAGVKRKAGATPEGASASNDNKSIKVTLTRKEGEGSYSINRIQGSTSGNGTMKSLKIKGQIKSGEQAGTSTDVVVVPTIHLVPIPDPDGDERECNKTIAEDKEGIANGGSAGISGDASLTPTVELPVPSSGDEDASKSNLRLTHKAVIVYDVQSNGAVLFRSSDVRAVWGYIFETVQGTRLNHNLPPLAYPATNISLPQNQKEADAKVNKMGLTHRAVQFLLKQLPDIKALSSGLKFAQPPSKSSDEEPVQENESGCARTERFIGRKPFDMFGWLASKNRKAPVASDVPNESAKYLNAPIGMRFRKLKEKADESLVVWWSTVHGRGLYTRRDIEKGEMIIEYAGEVIRPLVCDIRERYYESKSIGCYMFRINDQVIDATMKGNAARFINHSCEPNCEAKAVKVSGKDHILIFALRKICRGEELTYDYKFEKEEEKIPCTCGSKNCRKYLN